jgi:N-acetylmuramoyl-L-alanine amidase
MVKFMADPGHDLYTPGKRSLDGSMKEFEFNKAVAQKLVALFSQYEGVEGAYSHDINDGIDQSLTERTNLANNNGVDCYVSIHANAGATSASGIETFVYPKAGQETVKLATLIHNHVINLTTQKNRGVKTADYAVLRQTKMKSVLIECGFMTNDGDLVKLKSDSYRALCAEGIMNGLAEYYGLKKRVIVTSKPTQENGSIYQVVSGSFKDRENADKRVNELKSKGFESFVQIK